MEPSQIILWVVIGIIIAVYSFGKAKSVIKSRGNNPGEYGERIATLEEAVKNIEDDVKRIKKKLDLV